MMVLLWLSLAFGHTFDAGFLGLEEQAPGQFSIRWNPPANGAVSGLVPSLPCPVQGGMMRCEDALGPLSVTGLTAAGVEVVTMVRWLDGAVYTGVLRPELPQVQPERASGLVNAAELGARHLWKGLDHLMFVGCLTMLLRGWNLVRGITAFTIGHGITLGLVVLGGLTLPGAPVEALIALSIAMLARASLVEERSAWSRSPAVIAGGFGLLHGLGFASVLRDLGVPEHGLAQVLIGFHLGLEFGQLICIAALLPFLWLLRRYQLQQWPMWVVGSVSMAMMWARIGALGAS
ncbi:MAG: hypothetical protein GWP91_20320 [Rhodobacterales bacterium]|nr:hypothetical protein [Rhodobacterales bacterium]